MEQIGIARSVVLERVEAAQFDPLLHRLHASGVRHALQLKRYANRREGYLHGTADNTRSVIFKGSDELLGKFVNIHVTRAISMHLVEGELVEILD